MDIGKGKKRIKFELTDEKGDKVTLIFEGRLSREKFMQMADLIEFYGGFSAQPERGEYYYESSKLAKVAQVIAKYFPFGYFTSREVVEAYMTEYREPITLSTTSTYLARLSDRGYLERVKSGNSIRYRLARPRVSSGADVDITSRMRSYGVDLDL